eukprot:1161053-Pelagomonas_calceolata.AAC.15
MCSDVVSMAGGTVHETPIWPSISGCGLFFAEASMCVGSSFSRNRSWLVSLACKMSVGKRLKACAASKHVWAEKWSNKNTQINSNQESKTTIAATTATTRAKLSQNEIESVLVLPSEACCM